MSRGEMTLSLIFSLATIALMIAGAGMLMFTPLAIIGLIGLAKETGLISAANRDCEAQQVEEGAEGRPPPRP